MAKRKRTSRPKTTIKCEKNRCCVYPKGQTNGKPIRCFNRKKR